LFEEDLPAEALAQAVRWTERADFFLVAGSSLEVWPVAGLPELAVETGASLVIVNGTATAFDHLAQVVARDPVEVFLPLLAETVLGPLSLRDSPAG
jgi:NAD-dependent deacetylase